MSNSRQISGGRKFGAAPQRSVFANTCNILSRYVKEKRSLKDFNIEIDGRIECLESLMKSKSGIQNSSSSTMNLLTQMEKSAQPLMESPAPLAVTDSAAIKVEDCSDKGRASKETTAVEPNSGAQLTIFYAGRVVVFDNYTSDKAEELVKLASKWTHQVSGGVLTNILPEITNPGGHIPKDEKPRSEAQLLNNGSGTPGTNTPIEKSSRPSPLPEINGSDLPIARRSSVHRFLEKRKERAAARGPYQIQDNQQGPSSSSSRGDRHLDLKL